MPILRPVPYRAPFNPSLPPADFFCPKEVLVPSYLNEVSITLSTGLAIVASLDDLKLSAWAKNKGVKIIGLPQEEIVPWVWENLVEHSLRQGSWWTPSLDAWVYYHPSLWPQALAHAKSYATEPTHWLPLSTDFKVLPQLAAEAAPTDFFDTASLSWLVNYPRALKSYLTKPKEEIIQHLSSLWSLWQELFFKDQTKPLSLNERLLFGWLIENSTPPQSVLDSLPLSLPLSMDIYPERHAHAALLRTAPTVETTLSQLVEELKVTKDWRVVINCFDHPASDPSLGDIFHERYDQGALAGNLLRPPLRALARSRQGAQTAEIIALVFSSYDRVAKSLAWERLPATAALEIANRLILEEEGRYEEDVSLLIGLKRLDLATAFVASPYMRPWLAHPEKSIRLVAISLIGLAGSA